MATVSFVLVDNNLLFAQNHEVEEGTTIWQFLREYLADKTVTGYPCKNNPYLLSRGGRRSPDEEQVTVPALQLARVRISRVPVSPEEDRLLLSPNILMVD